MTDTSSIYSKRTPSGTAASVIKRRTLYLSDEDPRVKSGSVTQYENAYYAEIKIVPNSEYIKLLKAQLGISYTDQGDPIETVDIGALVTNLYPPTNFKVEGYETVTNNNSNTITAIITFDSPVDDTLDDGTLTFGHTSPMPVAAAAATATTTGATGNKAIDIATFRSSQHSAGALNLSWKGYTEAKHYNVTVTRQSGKYLPSANGKLTHTYPAVSATLSSSGRITFTMPSPTIPNAFNGIYTFDVTVTYAKGTSAKSRARVQIGTGLL